MGDSPLVINKLGMTLHDPPFWSLTPRLPYQKRYLSWGKKIRSDLFFCHLITNFVSSPFCCRCFWFRYCSYSLDLAKFPCKIVLENPTVISQEFSDNSFASIFSPKFSRILKSGSHFTSDLFFQSTFITRTTITGKEYKQKKQTKIQKSQVEKPLSW